MRQHDSKFILCLPGGLLKNREFGWVLFGQWKSLAFWTLCHWSLFLHSSEKNLLQCRNEYVFLMHIFFFLTRNYIIIMIHIDFLNTITFICKAMFTSFLSLAAYISIEMIERIRFFIFNLLRICPSFDEQHFLWWHIPFKKWQIIIKMSSQTKRMNCLRLKNIQYSANTTIFGAATHFSENVAIN